MKLEAKLKTALNENRLLILGESGGRDHGVAGPEPDEVGKARQGASLIWIERRYGDIGRDAIQERAMIDALNELIGAMNKP